MNHFGEMRNLVELRAAACGADHHHRAGASGILRQLRSHRRRQIGNLRRPAARRRRADPGRQCLCRAADGARPPGACRAHRHVRRNRRGASCCPSARMATACGSRPISWAAGGLLCRRARRAISRSNAVGALLAVALLDGDVLNAAAALKRFLRPERPRRALRQPAASTSSTKATTPIPPRWRRRWRCWAPRKGRKHRRAGRHAGNGRRAPRPSCRSGRADRRQRMPIWSSPAARRCRRCGTRCPPRAAAAMRENSAALAPPLLAGAESRRHGAGQGLQRQRRCR